LNEYVSNVIKENIISQLEGAMDLEVEQIEEVEREMASISRQREIDSWK
jgi:flagellar motor component MotA